MNIINDNIILDTFFVNNKYLSSRLKKTWQDKHKDIFDYLKNRYNDSDSLYETIFRIKYNIETRPVCKYCGCKVNFCGYDKKNNKIIFNNYCSSRCANLDPNIQKKIEKTKIIKYGNPHYYNIKKCKQTKLERYGNENYNNIEKNKQTCLEKYGVENPYQIPEIIENIKNKKIQTCLKKYGVKNVAQVPEIKKRIYSTREKNNLKKYGVKYTKQLDWVKEKEYETKKKNKSFKISKTEDESYILLKEKYSDIQRQYKSKLYPFNCDFYIPSLDLYIECQYGQFHHKRPYIGNEQDLKEVKQLKERADIIHKQNNVKLSRYDVELETWTIRDVKKRNVAKQNNINYIEFWNVNELKEWLNK